MRFSTGKMFKVLLWGAGSVILVGWLSVVFEYFIFPSMDHISFFDLNSEANLPTWLSSSLLLVCSALTVFIAVLRKGARFWWGWVFMPFCFALMSLDEVAQIHERFSFPLREAFGLSGVLYFGWVIPAAILILLAGLAYIRFTLNLPSGIRKGFILGWGVYLTGALILELGGASVASSMGESNLPFASLAALEETLEIAGLLILIRVFLTYVVLVLPDKGLTLTN